MLVEIIDQNITLMLACGGQLYNMSYSNSDCPNDTYNDINNITGTIYLLPGLEEGTNYFITVTVTLSDGGTGAYNLTATTITAG